jgi:hypothetical protein
MPPPVASDGAHKLPVLPIVLGVTSLIVLIAAGGIYLVTSQSSTIKAKQTPVVLAPAQPTSLPRMGENQGGPAVSAAPVTATPAPPVVTPDIAAPVAPSAEVVTEKSSPAIVSIAPARAPMPPPVTVDQVPATKVANPMQAAIDSTLDEGEKCMSRKKYDCAITSANTVMRLDPGNSQGATLKRRAKDAQDRALSEINIQ